MSFLGLDFGASFVKGGILDPDSGTIRSVVRFPFPSFIEGFQANHKEVDARAIIRTFEEVVGHLLLIEPKPEGLVMCSQMHGVIFTNNQGQPLSNYYSWQDQRAQEIDPVTGRSFFEGLNSQLTTGEREELGHEVRAELPSSLLFYLSRKRLLPINATASSLADFILAQACGQRPFTEATFASSHGLFNIKEGQWHGNVMKKLELPMSLLPEIISIGDRVGTLERRGQKIPCYTPIGDQQCALMGVGLRKGELSLNIATGSQASQRAESSASGDFQVRPYLQGDFLQTITHIPAGRSLNAMIKLFSELDPAADLDSVWQRILEKVGEIPKTDLQINPSFFSCAFGTQGSMNNLTEENLTLGHLFLAAFEKMAINYRHAAERLKSDVPWTTVVLSGGLAQKVPRLRSLIEREIPIAQRLPLFKEDTLQGLLTLGSIWSGKGAPSDL